MNLEDVLLRDIRANQPLATAVPEGSLFCVTDENNLVEQSRASAWVTYADASGAPGLDELTGDVTAGPGSGAQVATIADDAITTIKIIDDAITTPKIVDDAITFAKIQNVSAASKLLGRGDSGAGDIEEITLGTNLSMAGTTLNAAGSSGGAPDTLTYLTEDNETADLPNSRRLLAGTDIAFDDTVAGERTINASGGGGGGGGWTLVTSVTPSGTGGIMSFINLGAYNEILLFYRGVRGTPDFNFNTQVIVSINNGSSYLNTSGDYVSISTQGLETAESFIRMQNSITNGFKTGWLLISNFNTIYPKTTWTPLSGTIHVITTTSALNALRVYTNTGLDWEAVGKMYIFGR